MDSRREFGPVVASEQLTIQSHAGLRQQVTIKVGLPYHDGDTTWRCPCEFEGFEPSYPDMCGRGSLQALCFAVTLIRRRLEDLISDGWKVFGSSGEEESALSLRPRFGGVGVSDTTS